MWTGLEALGVGARVGARLGSHLKVNVEIGDGLALARDGGVGDQLLALDELLKELAPHRARRSEHRDRDLEGRQVRVRVRVRVRG